MPPPPAHYGEGPSIWQKSAFIERFSSCLWRSASSLTSFNSEVMHLTFDIFCTRIDFHHQNGSYYGWWCRPYYWLHLWVVEHHTVCFGCLQRNVHFDFSSTRQGAGPRGLLATLSQYMLSSAATFSFFLAIGSVGSCDRSSPWLTLIYILGYPQ
jgi:hypothetical protein